MAKESQIIANHHDKIINAHRFDKTFHESTHVLSRKSIKKYIFDITGRAGNFE